MQLETPKHSAESAATVQVSVLLRSGWLAWSGALLLFVIGMLNVPLRVIGWDGDGLPGDGIDSALNNYMLEHGYRAIRGLERFWHAPIFYPAPGMTGTTDPHIAMAPVYALLRTAGLSPERAFQGWFVLAFVLNFVSALWAARRLGFAVLPAAAAAYVFTFTLPVAAQIPHPQLLHRWLVPPALVTAWHFLHQPTNRRFAIIVTCWFGQFLLSAYIAFFLALILIVFTILTLIRQYRILPWRDLLVANWRVWVGRVLIVLAILPPLGGILVRHALVAGSTPTEYILLWSPVAHSWLIPPPHSVTATFYQIVGLSLQDEEGECRLFAGLIPYIAMIFALLAIAWTNPTPEGQRRLAVGLLGAAGLLLALVITRWGNFWLYEPLLDVPGFRQIRAVGRLILVLLFPLGLAVGECLTALGHRWLHKGATLATVALLIIMIAEHLLLPTTWEQHWDRHRHSLAQQVRWQDRLANIIRRHPRPQVVYVFPSELLQAPKYEQQLYRLQVLAMRSAQNVGLPCINGYSGYMPIEWDIFFGYRSLFEWLTGTYPLPQHQFRGLVLIGEPEPDVDPEYEGIMRQLYPPLPLPPWD